MTQHLKTVLWRRQDGTSLEHCSLFQGEAFELRGTVVAQIEETPCKVVYRVVCDSLWQTVQVDVSLTRQGEVQTLELKRDNDGTWRKGNGAVEALQGCTDIDLGITPATNTLPLRRLNLAENEHADVKAAWLQFPSLELRPLKQRYTRLGDKTFLYESRAGAYQSVLEVDNHGLVVSYADGWTRVD